MKMNKKSYWIPLLMALCLAMGLLLGTLLLKKQRSFQNQQIRNLNKLSALLSLIDAKYVDSVDVSALTENLIPVVLQKLDPHSVYLTAEERKITDEEMQGSFSGIGVQFRMLNDTIFVSSVVKGGPSERAGILPGDRIVTIDDSTYAGKKLASDDILKKLRGVKGSSVRLGIYRAGSGEWLRLTVIRDDIPVYSVLAKYKIGESVGYIRIGEFGRNTHAEFLGAIAYLKKEGCDRFVIDLRGNTGGLMEAALNIANEFLEDGDLIVYTKGKAYPREDVYANGKGSCKMNPVVVMIDEWSASASEILAGALQDNDRAYIVGRRSFGKGLVQTEIPFRDGSAVRLTIARFYVPSGRCIQKPYRHGADESYMNDIITRYLKGEFSSRDSIHFFDSLRYETVGGRVVYGGGGIMPDYFVPLDTSGYTTWYHKVSSEGLIAGFAYEYAIQHRIELARFNNVRHLSAYLDEKDLIGPFVRYAAARNVRGRPEFISVSYPLVIQEVKANIARSFFDEDAYWMIYQEDDKTLTKAVEVAIRSSVHIQGNPLD
jgi:carboxyl-terminal processing protease